jgi:hypothetical protein
LTAVGGGSLAAAEGLLLPQALVKKEARSAGNNNLLASKTLAFLNIFLTSKEFN